MNGHRCKVTCELAFYRGEMVVMQVEPGNATFAGWKGWCRGLGECVNSPRSEMRNNKLPFVQAYFR